MNDIINILACPKCKSKVLKVEDKIKCFNCKTKYPIKNDVPIMLISEAENDS